MSFEKTPSFYEMAWQHRLEMMKSFIDEGEINPLRVINRYFSNERRNPVVFTPDGSPISASEKALNPHDFEKLPTGAPAYRIEPIREEFKVVPYYRTPIEFLEDFLADQEFDAIVELGSGFGQNLIKLFYNGGPRDIPYYAGEITKSGSDAAEMLASLDKNLNLIPFYFDFNKPDLSAIKERGKLFVFTSHAIEQVKKIPAELFKAIASHGDHVMGVHFEPFGFQVNDDLIGKVTQVQSKSAIEMGFNINFARTLKAAHKRGEIELVYMAKNIMGGTDMANPTSLAIWQSPLKTQPN